MAREPVSVELHGVRQLQSGMRRLGGNIDTAADREFRAVADQAATRVRGRVPKRSGRLASSVAARSTPTGAEVGYQGIAYAGPVDFGGWPKSRPYIATGRYLYPVAQDTGPLLERAGEQAAKSEIRGMLWR